MKWIKKDLQQYIHAKEYVDTVIVPLQPFQLSNDTTLEKDALQRQFLFGLSQELETELTGRVLLTPAYNYLKSVDKESELERLHSWVQEITSQPFNYIFFITADIGWKKKERALQGSLLWLPGITDDSVEEKELQAFVRSQVEQITELIRSFWQE